MKRLWKPFTPSVPEKLDLTIRVEPHDDGRRVILSLHQVVRMRVPAGVFWETSHHSGKAAERIATIAARYGFTYPEQKRLVQPNGRKKTVRCWIHPDDLRTCRCHASHREREELERRGQ